MKENQSSFKDGFPSFLLNICACKLKWGKKASWSVWQIFSTEKEYADSWILNGFVCACTRDWKYSAAN